MTIREQPVADTPISAAQVIEESQARIDELEAEVERLRAQRDRLRSENENLYDMGHEAGAFERDRYREALERIDKEHWNTMDGWCRLCRTAWPCSTVKEVRAALDGGDEQDLNNPGPRGCEKMRKPKEEA